MSGEEESRTRLRVRRTERRLQTFPGGRGWPPRRSAADGCRGGRFV